MVWTRIWSIFTVKVMIIDFDFYCHCDRHSYNALVATQCYRTVCRTGPPYIQRLTILALDL